MKELMRAISNAVHGKSTYLDLYALYDEHGSCAFAEAFEKTLVVFKEPLKRKAMQAYSDIQANEDALRALF